MNKQVILVNEKYKALASKFIDEGGYDVVVYSLERLKELLTVLSHTYAHITVVDSRFDKDMLWYANTLVALVATPGDLEHFRMVKSSRRHATLWGVTSLTNTQEEDLQLIPSSFARALHEKRRTAQEIWGVLTYGELDSSGQEHESGRISEIS